MPDPKQLPYLLSLLDDESPTVQKAVIRELSAFGPTLEDELSRLPQGEEARERPSLRQILEEQDRAWLRQAWPSWKRLPSDLERLERALTLVADFQNGRHHPSKVGTSLDRLASEFRRSRGEGDTFALCHFLFQENGLRGARDDYYNPRNSNLVYVIEKKRGIPISLASVLILTAGRLGLQAEGCNFPGHFLARVFRGKEPLLIDCFDGGRILDEKHLARLRLESAAAVEQALASKASAETMVVRTLRNLAVAYQQARSPAHARLMEDLIRS